MSFKLFRGPSVVDVGANLANQLLADLRSPTSDRAGKGRPSDRTEPIRAFLSRVEADAHQLRLGIFRKARLANCFKWRLLEGGLATPMAEELTQMLLLQLSTAGSAAPQGTQLPTPAKAQKDLPSLLGHAKAAADRGAHAEAAQYYRDVLDIKPRHVIARTNLGVALYQLGQYGDAEIQFRRATTHDSRYLDAHLYLGTIMRWRGHIAESELPLRRAVKLSVRHADAQGSLGQTLVLLGRLHDAIECFEKARRLEPANPAACVGLGQVASLEGRFQDAESWFRRALDVEDSHPAALAGLAGLRKMTSADADWLRRAEKSAASGIAPLAQADLRFAIGKYWDDLGEYNRAFDSYRRANELQKASAMPYARAERSQYIDDLIRVYSKDALATRSAGCSDSQRPVLITGMMRSGTSLVEQIIASHPSAHGSGELQFWADVARRHEPLLRKQLPAESLRRKLALDYLQTLNRYSKDALRIVDKSTFNSDHLGLIHSVFPSARIVYVRRDPIDTCISCYFQQFSSGHNFTMDLADLTHYYREHRRLISHWQSVLPPGALLEIPYEELTADQEGWTRRILEFVGLEWNDRCLQFHLTERPVMTASFWQVRQKLYRNAVGRWRNYRRFIGPLRELADMD
jgi:tetratricopeptide (TPR) repeat protein